VVRLGRLTRHSLAVEVKHGVQDDDNSIFRILDCDDFALAVIHLARLLIVLIAELSPSA
jgi:hypothetical protein